MRVAVYRRVSTTMQVEEGVSLASQKERLLAYIRSQGWTLTEDYVDEGFSAKNTERPAMQRLIADIKLKRFDIILVYKLDRFVRSVLDLHNLLQIMDKHGVMFKSATEVFDTTSATGRLFITLIATLAAWERETIAERVYVNMLHRSHQGLRNGAPAPYGYDLADEKLTINLEEAKWVRYMFSQYQSHGSQNIAMNMNKKNVKTKKGMIWSDFSVRYVLRNPIYMGKIRWNYRSLAKGNKLTGEEVIVPVSQEGFEPIIDEETFEDAQKRMEERKITSFRALTHYPFSGVAKCAECGYTMSGNNKKRKDGSVYRYYKCRGRFSFGTCDVQTIGEESIEKVFLESFEFADPEDAESDEMIVMDDIAIQKELDRLKVKKERAEELYLEGMDKARYTELIAAAQQEEFEILKIMQTVDVEATADEVKELLSNIKSEWYNFTYEERQTAIQSIFKYITIEVVEPTKPGRYPIPPVLKITDYQLR